MFYVIFILTHIYCYLLTNILNNRIYSLILKLQHFNCCLLTREFLFQPPEHVFRISSAVKIPSAFQRFGNVMEMTIVGTTPMNQPHAVCISLFKVFCFYISQTVIHKLTLTIFCNIYFRRRRRKKIGIANINSKVVF